VVPAGVNVLSLQRMLGHTSAKVTLDTYMDPFDDDLDAVAVTLHRRDLRDSATKELACHACRRRRDDRNRRAGDQKNTDNPGHGEEFRPVPQCDS
jgi:hypothetical protein